MTRAVDVLKELGLGEAHTRAEPPVAREVRGDGVAALVREVHVRHKELRAADMRFHRALRALMDALDEDFPSDEEDTAPESESPRRGKLVRRARVRTPDPEDEPDDDDEQGAYVGEDLDEEGEAVASEGRGAQEEERGLEAGADDIAHLEKKAGRLSRDDSIDVEFDDE